MRALVFDGHLRFVEDAPMPAADGEAVIRVRVAGICNTDLEITRGYRDYRGILGHEFVGEVVHSPERSWIGRRVCGEITARCGRCRWCARGMGSHCAHRTVLGIAGRPGAFAEFLRLPPENLHEVPEDVVNDAAVFVEPLAAAYEILEQISISGSDRVIILGDGKLGLLCAQVLKTVADDVTLVGKHESKLALASALGIRSVLLERAQLREADLVVEATGSAAGFDAAVRMLRPRGTLVLKSTVARPDAVDVTSVVVNEVTIVGSRCGPFPRAIEALARGEIQVLPLISERFPIERAVDAMERATQPGVLKIVLET
jgi:threonine dehydrogenase-like Zn-dependent dehydrogenase